MPTYEVIIDGRTFTVTTIPAKPHRERKTVCGFGGGKATSRKTKVSKENTMSCKPTAVGNTRLVRGR